MWFVPLGRADALASWPMGVFLPSYIYQLGIMLLARFRPPLIVFSLPRPSGCHLRTAELEPESLLGPRAPNCQHCEPCMPERWKTTKGNHLRAPTAKHATALYVTISAQNHCSQFEALDYLLALTFAG